MHLYAPFYNFLHLSASFYASMLFYAHLAAFCRPLKISKFSPECKHTEWSIGLVTMLSAHRGAPKIMPEQTGHRVVRPKIQHISGTLIKNNSCLFTCIFWEKTPKCFIIQFFKKNPLIYIFFEIRQLFVYIFESKCQLFVYNCVCWIWAGARA